MSWILGTKLTFQWLKRASEKPMSNVRQRCWKFYQQILKLLETLPLLSFKAPPHWLDHDETAYH